MRWPFKDWILAITTFVVISGAVLIPAYVQVQVTRSQTEIVCQNAQTTHLILQAVTRNSIIITRIAKRLGLPVRFPPPIVIPDVPPECTT